MQNVDQLTLAGDEIVVEDLTALPCVTLALLGAPVSYVGLKSARRYFTH